MNIGKVFEEQIRKSVPEYVLLYRIPDAAQSFGNNSNLRFSRKNPFDYIMWDSKSHILFALELKSVMNNSISFERNPEEKGIIHYHQIVGLQTWSKYDGIVCGFMIEFRKYEKTIFLDILDFDHLLECSEKKSFSISDLDKNDIPYIIIPQRKLRTKYMYDIDSFLAEIKDK